MSVININTSGDYNFFEKIEITLISRIFKLNIKAIAYECAHYWLDKYKSKSVLFIHEQLKQVKL